MKRAIIVLFFVSMFGCAALMGAIAAASQGAQWMGSILDAADDGSRAYFARHPNVESEQRVRDELRRSRLALEALDGVLAAGEAADAGDLSAAKDGALKAYAKLRQLLDELGVPGAKPPAGGPENETAPMPEPFALPQPSEVAVRLDGG